MPVHDGRWSCEKQKSFGLLYFAGIFIANTVGN